MHVDVALMNLVFHKISFTYLCSSLELSNIHLSWVGKDADPSLSPSPPLLSCYSLFSLSFTQTLPVFHGHCLILCPGIAPKLPLQYSSDPYCICIFPPPLNFPETAAQLLPCSCQSNSHIIIRQCWELPLYPSGNPDDEVQGDGGVGGRRVGVKRRRRRELGVGGATGGAAKGGERRVIIQDGEAVLLLWYKDQVYAIENRSPAEGAYSEGFLNAKLTQFVHQLIAHLRTRGIKEWHPKNPVLRVLTPALRTLSVYPVKTDDQNIYTSLGPASDASAEIVFSGKAQPGFTATDVNVDEVKMVVDEGLEVAFGFTGRNEIINGKAAVIGFLLLLDFDLDW